MASYNWTGERLVTVIEDETATEHLHRYAFAMELCRNASVVDIACGEGYGSALLATVAADVTGIDIDPSVVKFASGKYVRNNLRFLQGNTSAIPLNSASADIVVSFETIEHHDQHDAMLQEIKRILKPGGLLVISTPDRHAYSDERNFKNQFHVKELSGKEFRALLDKYFQNTRLYGQRISYGSLLIPESTEKEEFRYYKGDYTQTKSHPLNPLYHIALSSDAALPEGVSSFFDGAQILESRIKAIYDSASYRFGYRMLSPLRLIARIFRSK
jgi:ubiquinone/menaquinone biosynthesis C-methylase UbiE